MTTAPLAVAPPVRMLVVDDEPHIRELLDIIFSAEGWHVDWAASGAEALERFQRESFDIVVLDQSMPGPNGVEVARQLRERDHPPAIVVFSAYVNDKLKQECLDVGVPAVDKMNVQELVFCCHELAPSATFGTALHAVG
jgi:CheY-like chemotaxis protein